MSRYWSNIIRELKPYVPGEQPKEDRFIKLNTNENPYPPSPGVIDAIVRTADASLRRYPDPNCEALKHAIARYYAVGEENVFLGNGSDEVLALSFISFFKQSQPILFPDISYSFYEVYCRLFEIQHIQVPLTMDLDISLTDYARPNGGIIFPNPNAPTGKLLSLDRIENLLKQNDQSVVIVDEAYIDFGGKSAIRLVEDYANLLVVQTFSKSRSLAGLRVGAAMGSEKLVEGLERAKNSFNSYPLDRLAMAGAIEAINDEAYFQSTRRKVMHTREWVVAALSEMGFSVVPSMANFVFVKPSGIHARDLYARLKDENVLVRYFNKPRIDAYLRVTIGTDSDMQIFIKKTAQLIKKG
ncbi:MAG: histidinol-phosphate transaminase [Deltaproteobacteria bacterium]|jgi:histidinol-phosphate aminotransferase|nr:histidinol-phosphate transaminase [Deltaproteobacteria bacterium]